MSNVEFGAIKPSCLDGVKYSLASKERTILLCDEVTQESVLEAMYYLYRFRTIDTKKKVKKPITILIDTPGGSVYDGLMLISLIESMRDEGWEINTVNIGTAYSMGFIISLVGTNRYAYRYSTYLLHDISLEIGGNARSIKEKMEETDRLSTVMCDIIKKYTDISEDEIEDIFAHKKDKIYSCDKAIELKICDKII